jgi:hypothetical protein
MCYSLTLSIWHLPRPGGSLEEAQAFRHDKANDEQARPFAHLIGTLLGQRFAETL